MGLVAQFAPVVKKQPSASRNEKTTHRFLTDRRALGAITYPAARTPEASEVQSDGRIRYWLYVPALGKYLRVITLADGKTLHNAFPDRSFKRGKP